MDDSDAPHPGPLPASQGEGLVTWVQSFPARPSVFPSPFDDVGPHPLAQHCAQQLMAQLRRGFIAPGFPTSVLSRAEGGKMFGVLVVEGPEGQVGFLQAVSGQIEREWNVPGYAPAVFDPALRALGEVPAEASVKALTVRVELARSDPALQAAREAIAQLERRHQLERSALKQRHAQNKVERQLARATTQDAAVRHALDQLSRADDTERRRAEGKARDERAQALAQALPWERRLAALERLRRIVSREAMRRIWDSYLLPNFAGEMATLRSLFPQADPPSGAADCAAPKLLAAAARANLRPLALAEFWWGAAPPGGARVEGMFFPACKEKCGPVLAFILRGLEVAPRETWKPRKVSEEELLIVHQDPRFLVLNKPAGLLSVPARDQAVTDSLVVRIMRRFPNATGPLAVHRLDLDTSGLLLVALDLETYRLLQAQFLAREVSKRYVALLEGAVANEAGLIELPLRTDLEQRPRQLVDFNHGKPAMTRWQRLALEGTRTRVAFFPVTGRTHQLRVHASHQLGLGSAIVGDRLYGKADTRLHLHAESLGLRHPFTHQALEFKALAPF